MIDEAQARQVALDVARCSQVALARQQPSHPCHKIVNLQPEDAARWQVPEGWAGSLTSARIVFISSNPSISDDEYYPRGSWDDDEIAKFVTKRFGDGDEYPVTINGRVRLLGGGSDRWSKFWNFVRQRAAELIPGARPDEHYVMTEIVHCKSHDEIGVPEAAARCARMHLHPIVGLSPAPLIVVLGAVARYHASELWDLPADFGTKEAIGDERRNLKIRTVAGTKRLITYLPHSNARTFRKFTSLYPEHLSMLIDLVTDHIKVEDAERMLAS